MTVTAGGEQSQARRAWADFAEVGPGGLTVLADVATSIDDVDRASLQHQIEKIEQNIKEMEPCSDLDKSIARLDHFKVLEQHLQGTAMQREQRWRTGHERGTRPFGRVLPLSLLAFDLGSPLRCPLPRVLAAWVAWRTWRTPSPPARRSRA